MSVSNYDEFESQYADDLEALRELEEDYDLPTPSSKRTHEDLPPSLNLVQTNELPNQDFASTRGRLSENDITDEANGPVSKKARLELPILPVPVPVNVPERNSKAISGENKSARVPVGLPVIPKQKKPLKPTQLVDCFPVTGFSGARVYLNLKNVGEETLLVTGQQICNLLGTSYEDLRDELERERECRLLHEGSGKQFLFPKEVPTLLEDVHMEETSLAQAEEIQEQLWVEKYKPHHYMQLLSDDGINRTLLRWLKLWDKAVFGKDLSIKQKVKKEPPTGLQKKTFVPKFEMNEELDTLNRPYHKIALLCGPPGLGKTTLAYIIAQHAGYNVVEMNASDDRSAEIFKQKLEAATQMRSVMGQEPRPNCLVIDEIDGAPAPAINVLVSYIKSTGAVKGKKGKQAVLLRPVICICNDLYTPALRPLRQLALVLNFPPTGSSRLASRLMEVTRREKLKTDTTALLALCEKAENDIRSCLATLQFLHSAKQEMRLRDVRSASIGQKDSQKSMFSVWQQIFQVPRTIRQQFMDIGKDQNAELKKHIDAANPEVRAKKVLHSAQSCGEYEKLLQGMFENYLAMNFKDPLLELVNRGTEWLCFADLIQQEINHTQLYTLMPYLPYTVVAFHFLFAVLSPAKLSYPSAGYEARTKQTQLMNIVATVFTDLPPSTRTYLDSSIMAMQILPFLLYVIQPTLRPVNTQLYSDKEKANLQNVINVMSAYNLAYRQERSPEGQYSYVLEPNVEEVIQFTGVKPVHTLSYGAKQMIARELEVEKMRQSERKVEPILAPSAKKIEPLLPNHKKQTLIPKMVKDMPTKDFFGREITKTKEQIAESKNAAGKGGIWYHFKEGYSNAVRRTIYIKDLL